MILEFGERILSRAMGLRDDEFDEAFTSSQNATALVFQDRRHTKGMHDNVHKLLYVDVLSLRFVDTEQFQRLRDVRQLAGAELATGVPKNDGVPTSSYELQPSLRSRISPYSRRIGRCKSTSISWNSHLYSGDSDVPCITGGKRILRESSPIVRAPHLQAEKKSCKQVAAEGQVTANVEAGGLTMPHVESAGQIETQMIPQSVESTAQTIPQSVESEPTIHLPVTVRDVAVHPVIEDGQEQDGLDGSKDSTSSTSSSLSKSRHVQWQVTASASPEEREDLTHGVMTSVDCDFVDYGLILTQDRVMKSRASTGECSSEAENVVIEQGFVQPLNKFITGGPLHALTSLTRLDLSKIERPGTPAGDLQQRLEQSSPLREHSRASHAENVMLYKSGPFFLEEPSNKEAYPATSLINQHSSTPTSERQCVLMRPNMAYEPVVKGITQAATNKQVPLRKKIKMKAPVPKQNSRSSLTKKPAQPGIDVKYVTRMQNGEQDLAHNVSQFQTGEQDLVHNVAQSQTDEQDPVHNVTQFQTGEQDLAQNHTKEFNDKDYIIPEACPMDFKAQRVEQIVAVSEGRDDEKIVTQDTGKPDTCVVTHSEHSIEVAQLQDPPSRRRWPKVSASLNSIANRNDKEMSSTNSSCESMQDGKIPNAEVGLYIINPLESPGQAAVQNEDVIGGHATSASSKDAPGILSRSGEVCVDEEPNSEQLIDRSDKISGQKDSSLNDPVVFKTGLRISVPSASVREISFDSASVIHQRPLPDAHPYQGKQGDEGEPEKLGLDLQSHWDITSTLPVKYLSCITQMSQEKEIRETTTLQESSSYPSDRTPWPPGHGNGSTKDLDHPGAIPQRSRDGPPNERFSCTAIASNKDSNIEAINSPASGLTTCHRGQAISRRATPERIKFGRGVWSSTLPHEEKYSERASLSSEKLCSILSYLGHVEESNLQEYSILQKTKPTCYSPTGTRSPRTVLEHDDNISVADSTFTTSLTNMSNRSATDSNANSGDGDGTRNPTVSLFEGVRKKIQHYKDRITGQESQNVELLRELERVKADKEQLLSQEREKFGRELEIRAAEYKAAIQHHLSLNEKMVKDKETLSEKCCNLAGILSTAESKFDEKLRALQDQAAQDLKKQKELWIAGEKPRREAWKDMKLKEIKEITIKGLEPHIEGIVEKHRQEMQKLETRYADETQKKLELQTIQQRQEMCELRDRLLKDRDDLLEKERMAALQRMNEVAEKYEQQAMQLRMRVSGDMAAELERVEESRRKDKHDAHDLLSKFQKEAADREDTLRKGLERAMQDSISKREDEISHLRAEIVKQKSEWQNALDEKVHQEMKIREEELQVRCTKERDEQIEMIIERMDMEKDEAVEKHQQELLIKVERLMEEKLNFMKRMKDVESKCASLCQLSLEAKQKAEMESENRDVQVASLERELSCQIDLIEQLKAQINHEKSNLKQQEERFENRIKKEQELLQSALLDVERRNAEVQQMRARKVEELAEVEAHVRQAIDNKDLVIAGLREQLLSAREQIRHTEILLS